MQTTTPTTRIDLDPRDLLVDVNIRTDARPDKDFVASIKDIGVLVPITAVRTAAGDVRVRFGHRRTLAAIEADLATVPVDIVGDEATDDAGQIERILTQDAENAHRSPLRQNEQLGVVEQLSALGLTAAQIAKRTKIKRDTVKTALAVTKSDLAKAASDRYDFLTLEPAAAVAEFDDDADAAKELITKAQSGQDTATLNPLPIHAAIATAARFPRTRRAGSRILSRGARAAATPDAASRMPRSSIHCDGTARRYRQSSHRFVPDAICRPKKQTSTRLVGRSRLLSWGLVDIKCVKHKVAVARLGIVSVGAVSLVGAVFDYRILMLVAVVTVAFWFGVVLPGVWSRNKVRRVAALDMVAALLGRENNKHEHGHGGDDRKPTISVCKARSRSTVSLNLCGWPEQIRESLVRSDHELHAEFDGLPESYA
jgi:ParB/RepB/Spo0J family partition protein